MRKTIAMRQPPSIVPVVLWTLVFAPLGALSAHHRTREAAGLDNAPNYWTAFWVTWVVWVVLYILFRLG